MAFLQFREGTQGKRLGPTTVDALKVHAFNTSSLCLIKTGEQKSVTRPCDSHFSFFCHPLDSCIVDHHYHKQSKHGMGIFKERRLVADEGGSWLSIPFLCVGSGSAGKFSIWWGESSQRRGWAGWSEATISNTKKREQQLRSMCESATDWPLDLQSNCRLCVYIPPDVHHYVHVIIMPFTKPASLASALIRHILLENSFVPFSLFSPHTSEFSDD